MKAEELAVIKERAEKATDGPWGTGEQYEQLDPGHYVYSEATGYIVVAEEEGTFGKDDAEFIAHAREDVPKLVAEVERLHAQMSEANQLVVNAYTLMAEIQNYHGTKSRIEKYLSGVGNE